MQIFFFKYILLITLLQLSHFPLYSPPPCTPPSTYIPPLQFMSMGLTYKFFGFYISYTIFNLPLPIFYLPFMLLILCTFSPSLPPTPPLITLHVISISVILFLFQLFAQFVFVFIFFLGSVVDICELVIILLFIVSIFFFLDMSL